jgi:SAM-dependent methyltransferase
MSSQPRSPERLRHHFEVESELAAKLRASTREERPALFKELYNELFERVPDHPRLTRRESPEESRQKVEAQMRLLRPFLSASAAMVEFAPGDCRLSYEVAKHVRLVHGVDISDQRSTADIQQAPANFELTVYDGYQLDLPSGLANVVFSYQFLEHLHPDDLLPHCQIARRLLQPDGFYVLDTPHRYSGPHDISRCFGDELKGFHFQEWTYRDLTRLMRQAGFESVSPVKKGRVLRGLTGGLFRAVEWFTGLLPKPLRRRVAQRLFQSVSVAAKTPAAR